MVKVTKQQIRSARRADLFAFLCSHHARDVETDKQGSRLRLINNHSISIKNGYNGYLDFATNESGNGIDLLMRHFGYTFQEAVIALCGEQCSLFSFSSPSNLRQIDKKRKVLDLPQVSNDYRRLMAYLVKSRCVPANLIKYLLAKGLVYQAADSNNIVFVSAKQDFAEIRGTLSDKPYHGVIAGSRHDGCWWFSVGCDARMAYITESAIDAMSLAVLLDKSAYYVSIAGASKQAAINRIKASNISVVIATDNDDAGDECRQRNKDCVTIYPHSKDWNDDLKNYKKY